MSMNLIGDCADCIDSICTMNCSSAVLASGTDWIAASIWAGVFPAKATAAQVSEFLAQNSGMTCPITADRDAWRGADARGEGVKQADREAALKAAGFRSEDDLAVWGNSANRAEVAVLTQTLARHRLAAEASFKAREGALVEALELLRSYGCPLCNGDCGSANPPVVTCPMTVAQNALARAHTATDAARPDA